MSLDGTSVLAQQVQAPTHLLQIVDVQWADARGRLEELQGFLHLQVFSRSLEAFLPALLAS